MPPLWYLSAMEAEIDGEATSPAGGHLKVRAAFLVDIIEKKAE